MVKRDSGAAGQRETTSRRGKISCLDHHLKFRRHAGVKTSGSGLVARQKAGGSNRVIDHLGAAEFPPVYDCWRPWAFHAQQRNGSWFPATLRAKSTLRLLAVAAASASGRLVGPQTAVDDPAHRHARYARKIATRESRSSPTVWRRFKGNP